MIDSPKATPLSVIDEDLLDDDGSPMEDSMPAPNTKREKWIKLRVSEAEILVLDTLIKRAGMKPSKFMRHKIFGTPARLARRAQPMPREIAAVIAQLSKIGNNLNQIAKKANAGHGIDGALLTLVLTLLRDLLLKLKI